MLKQWANKRNENTSQIEILHQVDFIWFLSDCVMNVLSGVVPIHGIRLIKLIALPCIAFLEQNAH